MERWTQESKSEGAFWAEEFQEKSRAANTVRERTRQRRGMLPPQAVEKKRIE